MPFSVRQSRPGLPLWRLPVPGATRRGRRQAGANRPVQWLPETEGLLWQYRVRELSAGCPAAMRRGTPPNRREPPCPMASRDRRAALEYRTRVKPAGCPAQPGGGRRQTGANRPVRWLPETEGLLWQYRVRELSAGCPAAMRRGTIIRQPRRMEYKPHRPYRGEGQWPSRDGLQTARSGLGVGPGRAGSGPGLRVFCCGLPADAVIDKAASRLYNEANFTRRENLEWTSKKPYSRP